MTDVNDKLREQQNKTDAQKQKPGVYVLVRSRKPVTCDIPPGTTPSTHPADGSSQTLPTNPTGMQKVQLLQLHQHSWGTRLWKWVILL